ncbi:MAG: sigma 54-interacting transcriptional regulator, partial [Planctomycetaceae bacterium]|nr:sigma 54-interacting transcriptional regulator [Planctomycetaceae bacterium]
PMEGRQFKLTPGQITTIGRAPTNRVAVPDEVCSRNHCEVFQSGGRWMVRDLDSRNGTRVQGKYVDGDCPLLLGQMIQLGSTVLWFTSNPDAIPDEVIVRDPLEADTASELVHDGPQPEILHRTRHTRFQSAEAHIRDRLGRDLARLYRLANDMATATRVSDLADIVLDGLLASTPADIGAVLMVSDARPKPHQPPQLELVVYKSRTEMPYQRVSDSLSRVTLAGRDAILARDLQSNTALKSESVSEICAQSVICAPLRTLDTLLGLIHLYSTDLGRPLEPEDLEFTLAVADQFAIAWENLRQRERLAQGLARVETENQTLREQLRVETELVGDSPSIQRLRDKIGRIAPTGAMVLIRGESGVGKELVARAIHLNSTRKDAPFVTMNCAALSESLLESELFGHERGSFTGAVNRKIGKFEQAHLGTIFLDEVGEMTPAIQAKFLRVLEGHPFERVGGGSQVEVDVRVVAATNRELEAAVEAGQFRKDLYFRLQVVELQVEPLRERRDDIPVLARFFLDRFAKKLGRLNAEFTAEALHALRRYDWPGNVRELQNTVERALILSHGPKIGPSDIQLSALGTGVSDAVANELTVEVFKPIALEIIERDHILAMLDWTSGNKSQAAQMLGIERSTLDRKLKRYDFERKRGSP